MNKLLSSTKELSDKYIMNTYKRLPLVIEKGEGVYLFDENGNKFLDFVAGIAVNCLGYGNKKFIDAVSSQLELFNHCSNIYYNKPQTAVAEMLVENSCFDKVFFCNSGAESIEAALKLCRKFGNSKKEGCNEIITMKNSFHGRTLGAITATGQEKYQKGLTPLLPNIFYGEYNNLESIKELINENTCAILMEVIQGEGGVIPADKEFLEQIRTLCNEHDILLVFDEVQTGIGRTGKLFAYENYNVEPDIICLAKGLASGIPIGAMMAKEKAAKHFAPGDHASTFGGNPIAMSGAKVVLDEIINQKLLQNVRQVGDYLKAELKVLKMKYPDIILDVRGLGLMLGVECNAPTSEIISECQKNGLLLIGAGHNVIRFVPPLVISKADVDEAVSVFEKVLMKVSK